jgi:hypothetical protein
MSEGARRFQVRTFETPELVRFCFSVYIAKEISVFTDKQRNMKAKGLDQQ